MNKLQLINVLLVVYVFKNYASAESYSDATGLQTMVLTGYKTNIRPVLDQTQALNITINALVYKVVTVDAVGGSMQVMVMFDSYWTDEKITWTPSSHNGADSIMLSKSDVWIPHLTLGNPVDMNVFDDDFNSVTYTDAGLAHYHCGDVVDMMCQFDGEFFPFDSQECDLRIFAFDQTTSDVLITSVSVDTSFLLPNPEWSVKEVTSYTSTMFGHSNANFKFKLVRQSGFYVFNIIIPLLGLGSLNPMVFILPTESGERVSYATTILLSMTVFMSIVGDTIPKSSDPLPLLIILLTLSELMALATTFTVMLNMIVYFRDDEKSPVTPGYRKIVRFVEKVNQSLTNLRPKSKPIYPAEQLEMKPADTKMFVRSLSVASSINQSTSDTGQEQGKATTRSEGDDAKDDDVTWQEVSFAIDTISFVVSLSMHGIVCMGFVMGLAISSRV